jgi:hypothetical protein
MIAKVATTALNATDLEKSNFASAMNSFRAKNTRKNLRNARSMVFPELKNVKMLSFPRQCQRPPESMPIL